MYFSVGILYSAYEFLNFLQKTPGVRVNFPEVFETFNNVASPHAILEVCQKCEWIRINIDGSLEVSEKGVVIINALSSEKILRLQFFDMLMAYKPNWLPLLSRGRSEALKYLPLDIIQCLREADLISSSADEVVAYWDKISKISRKSVKDEKLDTSRIAEKLSIEYERNRTHTEPLWQGFESNFSGYDVLSIQDQMNKNALMIEVKSSNLNWVDAIFHISRNEWNVAITSRNYIFHLWLLLPTPKLFVVQKTAIIKHIPLNQGFGQWSDVEVPYSAVLHENQWIRS